MKTYALHNLLLFAVVSIVSLCAFCSCQLEPPGPLPEEEIYVRAFVKNFGVISPDHTWSEAVSSQITVVPDGVADTVDVYADIKGELYQVARYTDVNARVTIPIDIPGSCDQLTVVADGQVYTSNTGGVVKLTPSSRTSDSSRASQSSAVNSKGTLNWLIIAEDMATTQEFDFNDIVVRLSLLRSNGRRTPEGFSSAVMRVTAMAAGGTLPIYLHIKDSHGDRVIGPNGTADINSGASFADCEWHKWFRNSSGLSFTTTTMVNTGPNSADAAYTLSVEVDVDEDFSMSTFSQYAHSGSINDPDYFAHIYGQAKDVEKISGFYITVGAPRAQESVGVLCLASPGVPPQMMLIPDLKPDGGYDADGWMWPTERTDIRKVYPDFSLWLSNPDIPWYLNPNKSTPTLLFRANID